MIQLDLRYYTALVQSCNSPSSIYKGKQLHLLFLKHGFLYSAITICNRLLQMYSSCGSINHAWKLFEEMRHRNTFTWNTMIEGYMRSGNKDKSLHLFNSMPDKTDFSWNLVISGFAKVGELKVARRLFDDMPMKNNAAWNSIIHGYAKRGYPREAITLFQKCKSFGDTFILATVIGACTELEALKCGKQIHTRMLVFGMEFDPVMCSSLINLYGKCGDVDNASFVLSLMVEPDDYSLSSLITGYGESGRVEDARRVFDRRSNLCVVVWNSMISSYISNNEEIKALILFNEMRGKGVQVDSSTVSAVLSGCSSLGYLENCKQLQGHACKVGVIDDIVVTSALLDAYSKCREPSYACKLFYECKAHDTILLNTMITVYYNCGRIDDAKQIFKTMPRRSLISWNSMIVGFSQNGCPVEALDLFCEMNKLDLMLDKFSVASVLSSCASVSSVELGEQIFSRAIIIGLDRDKVISSSVVDFYCKCGFIEYGRKAFDTMIKDEITWNSMLTGYATNGNGYEALNFFKKMRDAGVRPTAITFTGVLSACDHCGLVEEGRKWFNAMKHDYHVEPGIQHYSCMVDLLARAGFLEEAINLVESMPFKVDASMWSAVLRGCVENGCKTLGKKIGKKIIELDPGNSGAYVLLSGMFATSGDWDGSARVRQVMKDNRVRKSPGYSWAE